MAEGADVAEDNLTSLTKGCFVYKECKSKDGRRVLQESACFHQLPGEAPEDAAKRYLAFVECWTQLDNAMEKIIQQDHRIVFDQLIKFVNDSHSNFKSISQMASEANVQHITSVVTPPREIPIAALLAGVNMPDHDAIFTQLFSELQKEVSPYIVRLNSKKCSMGIKATMKAVLGQLMNVSDGGDSEDEELAIPVKKKRMSNYSMSVFRKWYLDSVKASDRYPSVVIILEDFEGFSPKILEDLILVLSESINTVPVVLIFGIATSMSIIHRSLTQASSCQLKIVSFSLQSPFSTLNTLITEVLLNPQYPFCLGGETYNYLVKQFLFSSLSIREFQKGLKFSVLEHFCWLGLSFLCLPAAALEEAFQHMTPTQIEMLRALPSMQKYIMEEEPATQIAILKDDNVAKEATLQFLNDYYSYRANVKTFLKILLVFLNHLPESPLGNKLFEVYSHCLSADMVDTEAFKSAWTYIRVLDERSLRECLEMILKCIQEEESLTSDVKKFSETISSYLNDLCMLQNRKDVQQGDSTSHGTEQLCEIPTLTTSERKIMFEERLKQRATRSKHSSVFTAFRAQVMDHLEQTFQNYLKSPKNFVCHEIFFFEQVHWLNKYLSPTPRYDIQTALGKPNVYLPSALEIKSDQQLSNNVPDISIAYHLHLECGRMINLYDWMKAFISVIAPGDMSEDKQIDKELHDRFMQCVTELQFLGLIKPTKRKKDHVQRLTWGLC